MLRSVDSYNGPQPAYFPALSILVRAYRCYSRVLGDLWKNLNIHGVSISLP